MYLEEYILPSWSKNVIYIYQGKGEKYRVFQKELYNFESV
jgi:hypothetical protein